MNVTEPQAFFCALSIAPTSGVPEVSTLPGLHLFGAPNPARQSARLSFDLPTAGPVELDLFDAAGRRVEAILDHMEMTAGPHEVTTRTEGLKGGIYFARLEFGTQSVGEKLVILP